MKQVICLFGLAAVSAIHASVPAALVGDWAITTATKEAAWLSVRETNGTPFVRLMWAVGGVRRLKKVTFEGGRMSAVIRKRSSKANGVATLSSQKISLAADGNHLSGTQVSTVNGNDTVESLTGKRLPPMPARPDLDRVRFGRWIELFNGRDLTGWKVRRPEKKNGWSARDGVLINETPKTDFSAYGDHANLMTVREFEDFQLHIEFRVPPGGNSGIYLRGMYEVQVLDRDSRMQGINGVGSIFARVKATENAGRPGGEWNTYDITLVDRHVTVVLNGRKVINNQPVEGPTGGALHSDVTRPGPIYLQGDHTAVAYRNIRLRPRL